MDRRAFLAALAASAVAQVPPPKEAKITSSVALWKLRGAFEERVRTAALAGIQSVEIGPEHAQWSDEQAEIHLRLLRSYGFRTDAVQASPDLDKTVALAKRFDSPNVIVSSSSDWQQIAARGEKEDVTFLTDSEQTVQSIDSPRVRLLCDLAIWRKQNTDLLKALAEAISKIAVIHVPAPDVNLPYEEIYRAIAKADYAGVICFAYQPEENAVESLIRVVDRMRANV